MNEDPIFAENADWLFMAQQAKERFAIESQIHMAMSHGSIETNKDGQVLIPSEDVLNIFQKIPGSPAYWRLFRNELYAKMEQYGPFHVFFTLSCAEARWACVLVEVLKVKLKRALKVMYYDNYEKENDSSVKTNVSWNGETSTVLVYDKNLSGANLTSVDKNSKDKEWIKSRKSILKEYIERIQDSHKDYITEKNKPADKKTMSATEIECIREEIETMERLELNERITDENISNFIQEIMQLEDEYNELKFNDVRYITTTLGSEEIKKIMTLENYLKRYLKQHSMSKTDFLKDHFLLITRIFDKRVHDFMQSIMKNEGIEDYAYRIEFQLRGKTIL